MFLRVYQETCHVVQAFSLPQPPDAVLGSRAYQAICRDARALQFSTKVFRRRRPLFLALREITSRCNEEPHRAECTAACPAAAQQATVCTAACNAVPRLIAKMRRISAGYESRVRRSRKPDSRFSHNEHGP